MTDKEQILKLNHGERYVVPESDYGKAEIWNLHGTYFLFEIPFAGGDLSFSGSYNKNFIDKMIAEYESWT